MASVLDRCCPDDKGADDEASGFAPLLDDAAADGAVELAAADDDDDDDADVDVDVDDDDDDDDDDDGTDDDDDDSEDDGVLVVLGVEDVDAALDADALAMTVVFLRRSVLGPRCAPCCSNSACRRGGRNDFTTNTIEW